MLGLVLTAGGARGAYQAGVLKRLGELPALRDRPSPFPIVAGASAGAINGSAARRARCALRRRHARDRARLVEAERRATSSTATSARSRARARGSPSTSRSAACSAARAPTACSTPRRSRTLVRAFPPRGIAEGIRRGHLYAVAVSATSYHSGRSFTFVEGRPGHPVWQKSRRLVLPVTLTHRHVLASSAIPIVFPPVRVASQAGDLWFGDGGLRLVTPLSPAIRLGATRLLSIGVRSSARRRRARARGGRRGGEPGGGPAAAAVPAARAGDRRVPERDLPRPPRRRPRPPGAHERARGGRAPRASRERASRSARSRRSRSRRPRISRWWRSASRTGCRVSCATCSRRSARRTRRART